MTYAIGDHVDFFGQTDDGQELVARGRITARTFGLIAIYTLQVSNNISAKNIPETAILGRVQDRKTA